MFVKLFEIVLDISSESGEYYIFYPVTEQGGYLPIAASD